MTHVSHPQPFGPGTFDRRSAIRTAWRTWSVLLIIPFVLFMWMLWSLENDNASTARPAAFSGGPWFLASMAYLLVLVPLSFFARSRLFRPYWQGKVVPPRDYLRGMMLVWFTLELGGVLSLVGCMMEHRLLPNMLPAMIAFAFFITLFPSGHAMAEHDGGSQDPARYHEPR